MRRISRTLFGVAALSCLSGQAFALNDGTCAGAPFINVIRPRAIEESANATVGPQIFGIARHPRGFVLMANNNGLLTYDGVRWSLLPLGRSGIALSVAVAPDGRMFAGGSRTFGEVVEDPTGQLIYQPLESQLPARDRNFSDVWQILISSKGVVYFRTAERLFVMQNQEGQAIAPNGRFSAAGLVNDVLYVEDTATGLMAVGPKVATAVPGGEFFKSTQVTAITEGADLKVLVGTQDRGLFEFDLERGQVQPLGAGIKGLQAAEILSVRALANHQIALGTLRNGLFILGSDGQARLHLNRDSGLPDDAVLALHASNGTLWAGTSSGVAQLLLPNPVENYGPREGLPGLVESIVRHNGAIYAASSQGVFRMTCGATAFEPIPGLRKQAFALLSARTLLVATVDGIYEVEGLETKLIRPGLARGLARAKEPDKAWAATQTGASGLEWDGGWTANLPVMVPPEAADSDEAGVEATSIAEDADGRLWVGLVTGRVLSGLPFQKNPGLELGDMKVFGEKDGLSGFAEVLMLKDGVRVGTGKTVLRASGGSLSPDPVFTKALGAGQGAFRIADARNGGHWIAAAKRPLFLESNGTSFRDTALLRTPAGSRILSFLDLSDREVWIGTDDGAFRYDPSAEIPPTETMSAHVRRVRWNETDLYSGGLTDVIETALPHLASLRFEVASSSLDDPSRNRYRFRLDGQDADWSPWTADTRKDYTNLGPGGYRFRVETRDVYGHIGREAGVSFVVLAPWYRKPWAMLLLAAAVAFGFYLILALRTRSMRKRQEELERIVEQKTSELREASFTDPLTGLRNRRYFAEVIDAEVSLACRPGSPALHMFLVDLDHFKQVNDLHGHAAGDEILKQTTARLKTAMRTSDIIFRWGGEEFLIVARGAPDLPRNEIANRVVRMIGKEPYELSSGLKLKKTCSVGFATFPFYPDNPTAVPLDAVIELADLSLYRAKQTGRNRAIGVSPQTTSPVPGELWKDQLLENLEKTSVSIEVLEGPPEQGQLDF